MSNEAVEYSRRGQDVKRSCGTDCCPLRISQGPYVGMLWIVWICESAEYSYVGTQLLGDLRGLKAT